MESSELKEGMNKGGFTLVELMVAVTAGAIVVSSVFVVGAGSSRYFQDQHRVAQTQTALRAAMDQLRRDVARAGFMGTPNSAREFNCLTPSRHVQAIEFLDNQDTATIPNAAENGVSADRLRLTGNYATADSYLAVGLNAAGNQITLQQTWQGFRRSFVNVTTAAFDANAFTDAFRVDRYLHIRTQQERHFFVRITGTTPATATVSFTPALPVGGDCVVGLADGAIVAPLMRIEYFIGSLGGLLDPETEQVTGRPTQLIRREVAFDAAATPVANSERIVLEYAVDFNLEFVVDSTLVVGAAPTLSRLTGLEADLLFNDVNVDAAAAPHRIRNVIANLTARTAEQDRRYAFVAPQAGAPLSRFRADITRPGAARVRTQRAEIFVTNIASRGLRP